jgi:hypothetical protein
VRTAVHDFKAAAAAFDYLKTSRPKRLTYSISRAEKNAALCHGTIHAVTALTRNFCYVMLLCATGGQHGLAQGGGAVLSPSVVLSHAHALSLASHAQSRSRAY